MTLYAETGRARDDVDMFDEEMHGWRRTWSENGTLVSLEPFVHQVGGHFPIICLDGTTVCKPLNDREHRFWSNSYGGPWYYPGSPANTRSSWMDWSQPNW